MRLSKIGIPLVPQDLRERLFGAHPEGMSLQNFREAKENLQKFNLWGLTPPEYHDYQASDFPSLIGGDIKEHIKGIAEEVSSPWWGLSNSMANATFPHMPELWEWSPDIVGWAEYRVVDGKTLATPVDYPREKVLVFDTENVVIEGQYPTMAVAVGLESWYLWLSPRLFKGSQCLIPMGPSRKLLIGHNVSFDRAKVEEEYVLDVSPHRFMDTMSLHKAVAGYGTQQRAVYMAAQKAQEEGKSAHMPAWVFDTSNDSLKDCVRFYLGFKVDKTERDIFVTGSVEDVLSNLRSLIQYCALDVLYTARLFGVLWPRFKNHLDADFGKVTFCGMLEMGSGLLPLNPEWYNFVSRANSEFIKRMDEVERGLQAIALDVVNLGHNPEDVWTKDLDWKPGKNKKPGWYNALFTKGKCNLTTRTRITPLLLQMSWSGFPLSYREWAEEDLPKTSRKKPRVAEVYPETKQVGYIDGKRVVHKSKKPEVLARIEYRTELTGKTLAPEGYKKVGGWGYVVPTGTPYLSKFEGTPVPGGDWYPLPHKDGDDARVGNPLAKDYLPYIESGILSALNENANNYLYLAASCAYWVSMKSRVNDQFVVRYKGVLTVVPQTVVVGTVTRRAKNKTWMVASSSKNDKFKDGKRVTVGRVGSELKTQVMAPPGYIFVGADVDSQELRLAAFLGDKKFGAHGATPLGMQTLMGSKEAGTDMHTLTAGILLTNRDNAKVSNYSRLYGAGIAAQITYLKQFNPSFTMEQCEKLVLALYAQTKGVKVWTNTSARGYVWAGGTESHTFNALEDIAYSDAPRTPVLGYLISDALRPAKLDNLYLTSRINWSVQGSGADYLHLTLMIIKWLSDKYEIPWRLVLTIHDEYRNLTKRGYEIPLAWLAQITHLWVWAFISARLGLEDLPLELVAHSGVDIDTYLRKDPVHETGVTPSQPVPLTPGRVLSGGKILEELRAMGIDPANPRYLGVPVS
jgi:DNA polymerase gamma 1